MYFNGEEVVGQGELVEKRFTTKIPLTGSTCEKKSKVIDDILDRENEQWQARVIYPDFFRLMFPRSSTWGKLA